MKFTCALSGLIVLIVLLTPAYSQDSTPFPTTVSRGRWPDVLLLRGPGAQIGASFRDLTPSESKRTDPNWLFIDRGGVVVDEVRPDGPASRTGLVKGDRITMFDGQRVRNAKEFSQLVEETPPGRTVDITVIRDGQARKLAITPTLATAR
jgi:S1-C subfamily serine protease